MKDAPSVGLHKITEPGIGEDGAMSVVIEITARLQAEIGLNHDKPASGAQNPQGFRENRRAFLERKVLEEIRREYRAQARVR